MKGFEKGTNFYIVRDLDDGELITYGFPESKASSMMFEVAEKIAFDDCYPVEVCRIVLDGRDIYYAGWMPGMRIEFKDSETHQVVWVVECPEWDH